MTRIGKLFQEKQSNVLNVYFTAGYPQLESTQPLLEALQHNGADLIELGMPYSDPLADGTVIQQSSAVALTNGMTIALLFEQLGKAKSKINAPIVLMGYMNPVLQFGFEAFCKRASEVGVDGLILPDLPLFEFETHYGPIIKKYGLDFIFLVTPETNEERVRKLDDLSSGFLYAVSSSSTTGNDKDFNAVRTYLERLKSYSLKNPILVGFGIKDKLSFDAVSPYANGAIIGSAFIQALSQKDQNVSIATKNFLDSIRGISS
jgi:tryptophan synthase alpha chain